MNIGKAIFSIRKERNMSQEEFGQLFHVTRQTVSNWENEKSYPDLQTLVDMSDMFDISLDKLLKGDKQMVKSLSKTLKNGVKWDKLKKVSGCILIFVLIVGIVYTYIWNSNKGKCEAKFQEGVTTNHFTLIDEGYYLLETSENISFSLPNQKMTSWLDFSLDFHAKHLDAEMKMGEDRIVIRWLDDSEAWLHVLWDGEDRESTGYRIDENGVFLEKEADGTQLGKVPDNVKALCDKYQSEIQEVIQQGTEIYRSVYR